MGSSDMVRTKLQNHPMQQPAGGSDQLDRILKRLSEAENRSAKYCWQDSNLRYV